MFFDKTCHPVLRNSALVLPESAPPVHFFKAYFFASCFPTIPLKRTKLKYGTIKLNSYEKIIWMIELGAIRPKGSLSVHPDSSLWLYLGLHSCGAINQGLSNKLFTRNQIKMYGHAAKYLCIFCSKVWIWCNMTKALRDLFRMHPRVN